MLKKQILSATCSSKNQLLRKVCCSAPAAKEFLVIITKRHYAAAESGKKQSLVILGAGWGGFRLIKSIDLQKYEVSVVTPRNHFLFTPLLPSAASGTLEFRSIIEPIRKARHDPDYHYYEASCTRIDTEKQIVECAPNHPHDAHFELKYDKLVVAVGCDVNTMGVKGVTEHAFFLKEVQDARRIRNKIIECFERASNPNTPVSLRERLLHFIIVGAGPTGVESAAELHDLINQDLKYNFPEHLHLDIKITILEAGKQILSAFDKSLQKYTQKFFYRKGVQIYMGTKVKEVKSENLVVLDDGSEIECGLVLWSAGIQARGLLMDKSKHDLPVDDKFHKVVVDEYLRIKGVKNAFAMGDCSLIAPKPLPATAQVAQQQGYYLARLFNKYDSEAITSAGSTAAALAAKGTPAAVADADATGAGGDSVQAAKDAIVPPFVYEHQGLMAYIGDFHAVTEIKAGQSRWFRLHGYVSWFLYRSAYLTKLVSWKNKLLVPVDWAKSIVFGRDISKF